MKATQEIAFCDYNHYANPSYYYHQTEQKPHLPVVKYAIFANSNSRSNHLYNFEKYDKAFMIAIDVILPQE